MKALLFATLIAAAQPHFTPWQQLVIRAAQTGSKSDVMGLAWRTLSRFTPSEKAPEHLAEYFSVVAVRSNHQVMPLAVEAVSENWVLYPRFDQWLVDQWTFTVSLDGSRVKSSHNYVIEGTDRIVIATGSEPNDQGQHWLASLGRWKKTAP